MTNQLIRSLVASIGVPKTASHLLALSKFNATAENFFIEHFEKLSSDQLLTWLSIPPPNDEPRPINAIAATIAKDIGSVDALYTAPHLRPRFVTIADSEVRNELLTALKPVMDVSQWSQWVLSASGGSVFNAIRDAERARGERALHPDHGLLPTLTEILFDARRDDARCKNLLLDALADLRQFDYALPLLQETSLLTELGPLSRVLGDVRTFHEVSFDEFQALGTRVDVAREWPIAEEREAWFIRRALNAAVGGVPWTCLWWELPAEYRDAAALESRASARPAPWLIPAIGRCYEPGAAWQAIFELANTDVPTATMDEIHLGLSLAKYALGRQPTSDEMQEASNAVDEQSRSAWIFRTPLPQDADEEFDQKYVALAFDHHELQQFIVPKLLSLPLTQGRARRTIKLMGGSLWGHERQAELIEAAGRMDDAPLPYSVTAKNIPQLKTLIGEEQTLARLGARLDRLLREDEHFRAIPLAALLPGLVTERRRAQMREVAFSWPLSEQARQAAANPWLLSQEEVLAHAQQTDKPRWGNTADLPQYLAAAMAADVPRVKPHEAEALLERLETKEGTDGPEGLGYTRRDVLTLALRRIKERGAKAVRPTWLGAKLNTKALWNNPGIAIISAMLHSPEEAAPKQVLLVCYASAKGNVDLLPALHHALARACLSLTKEALELGQQQRALRALTALVHLTAPARLRKRIHALKRFEPDAEVAKLIDTNVELLRRARNNDPAPFDFISEALCTLVAAEPSPAAAGSSADVAPTVPGAADEVAPTVSGTARLA